MMFAETIPDARALQQFLGIISFFVAMGAGIASVAALFTSRRSQRREISFTREYASKEELTHLLKDIERIEADLTELRKEMKADRTLIMAAADERMEKLTTRVDRLLEGVSRIEGLKK
ncbi:MAG TPA: hypothetical protein VK615_08140 [Candidatus Binatia bacterium]|nr:hypothetical protein [Candidatus Binatia bacterium]